MTEKTTDTAKEADSAATTEQTVIDDTIITAGSLSRGLKKCREAADMDLRQAADEMRLPIHVLKALEAEEFADLPEPPYIRGYLRSYSRLNDSDPNELIRRYEVLRGANPDDNAYFAPGMPINRATNKSKSTVSPATVKLAGLALMVLVLGVLSMIPAVSQWVNDTWRSFSEQTEQQQLATKEGGEEDTGDASRNQNVDASGSDAINTSDNSNNVASNNDTAVTTSDNEQLALNNQDGDTATDADTGEAGNNSDTTATTDTGTEGQSDANTTTDTPATAADSDQTTATSETGSSATQAENLAIMEAADRAAEEKKKAEEEAAAALKLAEEKKAEEAAAALKLAEEKKAEEEAAAALKLAEEKKAEEEAKKLAAAEAAKKAQEKKDDFQQPIDGTVNIQLIFSESVWMSIKDPKGKNIFASLNGPGTRKQLKARTPLMFRVGNAPGVKIYLNGQLVDQKPYTRGSVSQFRIH